MDILNLNKLTGLILLLLLCIIQFGYSCNKRPPAYPIITGEFQYPIEVNGFDENDIDKSKIFLKSTKVIDSGEFKMIGSEPIQVYMNFYHSNPISSKDSILIYIGGEKNYISSIEKLNVDSNSRGSKPFIIQYNLNGKIVTENDIPLITKNGTKSK